jgi:hypothetical protein
MNPYLTDATCSSGSSRRRAWVNASGRLETSNNDQATAALALVSRPHRRGRPGMEPRARSSMRRSIADDVVSFGTVNLDSWALYRNPRS